MKHLLKFALLIAATFGHFHLSSAGEVVAEFSPAPPVLNKFGPTISLSDSEVEAMTAPPLKKAKARALSQESISAGSTSGFTIDRTNRNAVAAAYHRHYLASKDFEATANWTGDVSLCDAGTVSSALQDHTLRRINYYRAQAGLLADIFFTTEKNEKSQESALMMAANQALSHTPPNTWNCFTQDGYDAAYAGNLALGSYGPASIDQLIEDDGGNNAAVGHRRWFLYPRAQEMGNGSIPQNGTAPYNDPGEHPATDVVWVIGDFKEPQTAQAVAWPNDGYVPWNLVPNDGTDFPRWSYSYPGADFTNASVTMTRGGEPISVFKETVAPAFGSGSVIGDNTIVWRPSSVPDAVPDADQTYQINITGIAGPISSASYSVTLINPNTVNDLPIITGTTTPPSEVATTYNFSPTDQAEGYLLTVFETEAGAWSEGAETSPSPNVIDNTDGSYELLSDAQSASGSRAFHLATPDFGEDSFSINRLLVPDSSSSISFSYRRFFMHPDTKLRIELSADEGNSFTTVASIDGGNSSGNSVDWDPSFSDAMVDVPASFESKSVMLRFRIEATGLTFTGSSANHGVHIDDISISSTTELTNPTTQTLASNATSFDFTPGTAGQEYRLVLQPDLGGTLLEFGPALDVQAISAPDGPTINSPATAQGVQGEVFSYTITATGNPTSFDATGLPSGASVDTATGEITGSIAVGVHSDITLSATNAGGTDEAPLTITVLSGYEQLVQNQYPGLGLPDEDDDNDGTPNIVEVGINGRNPLIADSTDPANFSTAASGASFTLSLKKSGIAGLDYLAEGSATLELGSWTTSGITILTDNETDLEVSYPISGDQYFLRVEISQNQDTTIEP